MSPPLISKAAARYTGAGGKEHCSLCRHFSPRRGGRCARVLGDISPMGWCRLFSREMRGLVADASSFNGGGGPALSLDFMTPGTLDPRITFTRASTGTYFDSAGVMQTAALNAPRWDYDPATLALRGLLLEDQRQNAAFPSVPSSGWTATTITPVPNSGIAPDGTNSFVKILNTAATSFHGTGKAFTITAGQSYTVSVYARAGEIRYLQIIYDDAVASGSWATFDLQSGTIAAGLANGGGSISSGVFIQSAGGGVYRCGFTATVSATATSGRVYFINSLTPNPGFYAPTYAGTITQGSYLWGAQLEAGDFATSYIPTSTVAVTRNIDICLIPPANMGWFTAPGGSWFAEFDYLDATPSNARVIGRPDTAGGVSPLFLNAPRNVAQNDGATLATANTTTAGAITKACSTWAAGQARICANGGAIASSGSLPTGYGAFTAAGVRLLSVGAALGTDNTSGHIRAVRYWSTILSDASMQALTT
jgi:hypothetical protein